MKNGLCVGLRATGMRGDQTLARRHHVLDQNIVILFDPDVAARDHAHDNFVAIDHGETLDARLAHEAAQLAEGRVGGDRLGI